MTDACGSLGNDENYEFMARLAKERPLSPGGDSPRGRLSFLITSYRVIDCLRSDASYVPAQLALTRFSREKITRHTYILPVSCLRCAGRHKICIVFIRIYGSPPSTDKRLRPVYSSFIVMADLQHGWHDFFSPFPAERRTLVTAITAASNFLIAAKVAHNARPAVAYVGARVSPRAFIMAITFYFYGITDA